MSKRFESQDATQIVASAPGIGILFAYGAVAPSDGAAGYAPGCLFLNTAASAGSIFLCNEGSATSADFDAVTVA